MFYLVLNFIDLYIEKINYLYFTGFVKFFIRYCEKCDKTITNSLFRNQKHCQACKRKFLLQCVKCNKKYKSYNSMICHIKYHCGSEILHCKCRKCGRNYDKLISLQRHEQSCVKERNFCCKFCPYVSKFKHNLKGHLRTHFRYSLNGEQPNLSRDILLQAKLLDETPINNVTNS